MKRMIETTQDALRQPMFWMLMAINLGLVIMKLTDAATKSDMLSALIK